jgi:hypothetical protein
MEPGHHALWRNEMRTNLRLASAIVFSLFLARSFRAVAQAQSDANSIESKFATIDGIKIHYLAAGHGPAVILLHGYTQTSRMSRPLIPLSIAGEKASAAILGPQMKRVATDVKVIV